MANESNSHVRNSRARNWDSHNEALPGTVRRGLKDVDHEKGPENPTNTDKQINTSETAKIIKQKQLKSGGRVKKRLIEFSIQYHLFRNVLARLSPSVKPHRLQLLK